MLRLANVERAEPARREDWVRAARWRRLLGSETNIYRRRISYSKLPSWSNVRTARVRMPDDADRRGSVTIAPARQAYCPLDGEPSSSQSPIGNVVFSAKILQILESIINLYHEPEPQGSVKRNCDDLDAHARRVVKSQKGFGERTPDMYIEPLPGDCEVCYTEFYVEQGIEFIELTAGIREYSKT
ncbi:hypothetical protein ACJJTC_008392 [Scirpophaga incertulas]